MIISAIAAMAENGVIGRNNTLPWKLQDDLIRFRKITMNHPIIMGRKTFESIGKILPGREHFIISRNPDYKVPGATVVSSLEQAMQRCEGKTDEAFIIGGAEIYRQSLPCLNRLYLTIIHQKISGDAYFPTIQIELGPSIQKQDSMVPVFKILSQEDHLNAPLSYSFLVLEKMTPSD